MTTKKANLKAVPKTEKAPEGPAVSLNLMQVTALETAQRAVALAFNKRAQIMRECGLTDEYDWNLDLDSGVATGELRAVPENVEAVPDPS